MAPIPPAALAAAAGAAVVLVVVVVASDVVVVAAAVPHLLKHGGEGQFGVLLKVQCPGIFLFFSFCAQTEFGKYVTYGTYDFGFIVRVTYVLVHYAHNKLSSYVLWRVYFPNSVRERN